MNLLKNVLILILSILGFIAISIPLIMVLLLLGLTLGKAVVSGALITFYQLIILVVYDEARKRN